MWYIHLFNVYPIVIINNKILRNISKLVKVVTLNIVAFTPTTSAISVTAFFYRHFSNIFLMRLRSFVLPYNTFSYM